MSQEFHELSNQYLRAIGELNSRTAQNNKLSKRIANGKQQIVQLKDRKKQLHSIKKQLQSLIKQQQKQIVIPECLYTAEQSMEEEVLSPQVEFPDLGWVQQYLACLDKKHLDHLMDEKKRIQREKGQRLKHRQKYLARLEKLEGQIEEAVRNYRKGRH